MATFVEIYHQWRKKTFPASKDDVAWRHSIISARLDGLADDLREIRAIAGDLGRVEAESRGPGDPDARKLDGIAKDLRLLKQKHYSFQSKSASDMTLAIADSVLGGKVKFLQIGGNDGYLADPAYKYIKSHEWRGVILEPVPDYFAQLRKTYEDRPLVKCVNAAVDLRSGQRTMYKVKDDVVRTQLLRTGDNWLQGCASFSKERLLKSGLAEDEIESVAIETISGAELVAEYGLEDCDILLVDVEGAEDAVLSSFDFGAWRPRLIIFESEEKTAAEMAAIEARLSIHGYEISWEYYNSVALLAEGSSRGSSE